jgi:hypothetical protein
MKAQKNLLADRPQLTDIEMDAFDLGISDHRKMEKLFKDYDDLAKKKIDVKKRSKQAVTICKENPSRLI